ncbi:putative PEP-binding protein [Grimontia sp. NTOU-MAR1]|uniref:putative PEP-binding protein n=1 Tax=Grimontia sp. NTOU-MAR1 TaxID=3111011 RepID=UPI002DBD4904|nr:putative PEP-binding protein [Grimontia sp. NTOU-MAR1]WRV98308.1 putative PEP-binding protein [Grimontia sp. NTOU-MAR1]
MSQMDLTYSHVLKNPSQLEEQNTSIGLVSLGDLYLNAVGTHPSALDDSNATKDILASLLERACKANSDRPFRVMLNDQSALALKQLKGADSEPEEANPAMGLRGVSRYASEAGKPGFVFECEVLKKAIQEKQLPLEIVVPFVRTSSEAATMIDLLAEQGLCRGANGLKVLLACQLPANAVLAESLLAYFDGIIIDVDNLAAFTLAVDFGDEALPYAFNKHNEAVKSLIRDTIRKTQLADKPVQVLAQESDKAIIELAEGANVELVYQ